MIDNKSPHVSSTLLRILADLINALVWMVSTRPLISTSSSPFTNLSVTVPKAPINIGINVTFMFFSFFQFSGMVELLIILFPFFQFYSVVSWDSVVHNSSSSLFLLIILRSGRLAEIRWSVCISKSQGSFCVSFTRTDARWCICRLFVWSNFNFLHSFQWSPFPPRRV